MKIAIDAMGGDYAPSAIIQGLKSFIDECSDIEFILVGQEQLILDELTKNKINDCSLVSVVHTNEVVEMGESPVQAIKTKKNSSMSVMIDLLRDGKVDAVLSAGNTGAMVAASTLKLRTLKGIDRPGIATVMPTATGQNIIMDVGAVTDCKVKNIFQFAVMGVSIAQLILDIPMPTVGLLNVGEEESKGNELSKESYVLLKNSKLNFKGNVEGKDIFKDTVNVIVMDGFVGNVVLKTAESLAKMLFSVIKNEIRSTFIGKIAGLLLKPTFKRIIERFNHEEYGGALLLGVNGVVIISHGSSSPLAIKSAIKLAVKMVEKKVNLEIIKKLENLNV